MFQLTRILIIIILIFNQNIIAKEPKSVEDVLDLLNEQHNKWFQNYTCEFEIYDGLVSNGKEALTKRNFEKKCTIRSAKKNDEYTYQRISNERFSLEFPDFFLRSDKGSLRFNPQMGIFGLTTVSGLKGVKQPRQAYSRPEEYFGMFQTTLYFTPAELKQMLGSKIFVGKIQKCSLDWPPLAESLHVNLESDYCKHDIYLDPNQGYLPIKCVSYYKQGHDIYGSFDPENPALGRITVLTESKEFSRGRFFPTKVMTFYPKNRAKDESGQFQVIIHQVTKLEVDKEPTPEDMSIPIPAGCLVGTDLSIEGPYITLRRDEKVKPSHIPQLISMLEKEQESRKKRGERAIQDTALIDPPPSRGWSSYLWWAVGGLALLSLLLYLLRRFSRKSS